MSSRSVAATALLILTVVLSSPADASECPKKARYEIIMLGNLGAAGGYANDVNELGQVTGASSQSDQTGRAFVWDCSRGMRNIGAIAADHFASVGLHINNRGQIAGQSVSEEESLAVIWDRRAGMRAIASGTPYSLNDRGEVTYVGNEGTVLWTEASGGVPLETLSRINFREAFVNEWGHVGGYGAYPGAPDDRFLVWSPRRGVDPRGAEPTDAYMNVLSGFNNRSDLLGVSFLFAGAAVPFIVDRNGELQRLFEPRPNEYFEPTAFNTRRQVIGFYFPAGDSASQQPFLWDTERGLQNLNTVVFGRIPSANEPQITRATGINEWGWIAAAATTGTGPYGEAALLVPVPVDEPRYRNLGRLRGAALCAALASSQLSLLRSCVP